MEDKYIKDDSVFLFSFSTNKIYHIKKGSDASYEDSYYNYGIFFGRYDGNNPILLGWKNPDMLNYNSETCTKSNTHYDFTIDYELNNREKKL